MLYDAPIIGGGIVDCAIVREPDALPAAVAITGARWARLPVRASPQRQGAGDLQYATSPAHLGASGNR